MHTADVGISVMIAADIAREAADLILGEPCLRVLHRGMGFTPLPASYFALLIPMTLAYLVLVTSRNASSRDGSA